MLSRQPALVLLGLTIATGTALLLLVPAMRMVGQGRNHIEVPVLQLTYTVSSWVLHQVIAFLIWITACP